jgi:hypothetical protein
MINNAFHFDEVYMISMVEPFRPLADARSVFTVDRYRVTVFTTR